MEFLANILRGRSLLLILFVVAPFVALSADTIYLKNGQTLTGDIVQQSRTEISIQTTAGVKRVQKTTIRRVVFSSRQDGAAREEAARKARQQEEAARKAREAAARKQQQAEAERRARQQEEAARKAREEAVRKQQQAEAERADREAAERAAQEDAEDAEEPQITRGGALWRSLILPGWGQSYQGRSSAAWGYGGAFLATGALNAVFISELQTRQAALDAAGSSLNLSVVVLGAALPTIDPTLALRPQLFGLQFFNFAERNAANGAARSASRNVQLGNLLLGAVYVASIVDVIVFHPGDNMNVALFTAPDGGAGLRLQLRF